MVALSITPGSVVPGTGTPQSSAWAGEAVDAGDPVYQDAADVINGKASLKKCDNTDSAKITCVGIAVNSAGDNQPLTYQKSGTVDLGATTVKGTSYYAIQTGGIGDDAEVISTEYVVFLGVAIDTAGNLMMGITNSGIVK